MKSKRDLVIVSDKVINSMSANRLFAYRKSVYRFLSRLTDDDGDDIFCMYSRDQLISECGIEWVEKFEEAKSTLKKVNSQLRLNTRNVK